MDFPQLPLPRLRGFYGNTGWMFMFFRMERPLQVSSSEAATAIKSRQYMKEGLHYPKPMCSQSLSLKLHIYRLYHFSRPLPRLPSSASYSVGACPNKKLTLSPLCVLLQASAIVGLTSIVSNFSHRPFFSSCGTVFVTTTRLSLLAFSVSIALPLRMACVTMARTSEAPCSAQSFAAVASVPHVSAMSSTRIAMREDTVPTRTILLISLGRGRSLWIRAKGASRRSAMEVALEFDIH